MTTIQHKNIPDAQLHEPKGVAGAANKTVYKANGAASGTWSRLNEVDLDYSVKANNLFGWNDISDSQYTSGAPRAIAASTRTQMTNNGLAVQTDQSRLGNLWVVASNQFLINDLNAFYQLRINCKIKAAAGAGTPYVVKFELESASGPIVIAANDMTIKGGSYENDVSLTIPFYLGTAINNAAMKVYVTADTPITLYNFGFVLKRSYKET